MGPMLLLVLGMLSAIGLGLYQFSEHSRFNMVADGKNGGIFIIDRKSSAVNYCDNKTCSLVGNGSVPSQALQRSIIGAPSAAAKAGQIPAGMKSGIGASKGKAAAKAANSADDAAAETAADATGASASDDASAAGGDEEAATGGDAGGGGSDGAEGDAAADGADGFTFN